ncbi:MAG: flagellar export protein FliJ [Pseudomonadota bacterium]
MKSDPKRLQLVKDVFARQEEALAREMGRFQQQIDTATTQLAQLREHREAYTASIRGGYRCDPSRLQNQQAFAQRLNEAIHQQEQLIERAEAERLALRARWLARHRKTQSVEKLCDRREETARHETLRQEQKQLDDLSGRHAIRRPGKDHTP